MPATENNTAPPDTGADDAAFAALTRCGLNLHAVIDAAALPATVHAALLRDFAPAHAVRQLILIGNAGPTLWRALQADGARGSDPIDEFSLRTVAAWFAAQCPGHRHTVLYPGERPVGLQALGRLAGWHHAPPFKVGILPYWGSWFGYRVALLADSALPATAPLTVDSPCERCANRPCVTACPARAMADGEFSLERCVAHRRQPASPCRSACLARDACPVGRAQRYDDAHMRHTYETSLRAIERYF